MTLADPLPTATAGRTAAIVARALLLRERAHHVALPTPAEVVDARTHAWAQHVAGRDAGPAGDVVGSAGAVDRPTLVGRLAEQGLSRGDAARCVLDVDPAHVAPATWPDWAVLLDEVLSRPARAAPVPARARAIPFVELLVPFAATLSAALADRPVLAPGAVEDLVVDLLGQLSGWAGRALYEEFALVRGGTPLPFLAGAGAGRARYDRFVASMLDGGFVRLLERLPVLARALAQVTLGARDNALDLACHAETDGPELAALLGRPGAPGRVEAVDLTDGDPHRGGRRVVVVRFSDGLRAVHKPRSVALEAALQDVVRAMAAAGAPATPAVLRILDRGEHGWVEFVEHRPCEGPDASGRYGREAGALLCVAHLLDLVDGHHENVIADGASPVLVDAEALLHHRVPEELPSSTASAVDSAWLAHSRSPARTTLLPTWQLDLDGESAFDIGGFSGDGAARTDGSRLRWRAPNTDAMALVPGPSRGRPTHNLPRRADGTTMTPDPGELLAGFAATYRFLLAHREDLLGPTGPLAALRGAHTRIIVRPTEIYGRVLGLLSRSSRRLADGVDAGLVAEVLARPQLAMFTRPLPGPVLESERRALARLDVPVFSAPVDGTTLCGEDGLEVPGWFPRSSWDLLTERVAAMSEAALGDHLDFLLAALSAGSARVRARDGEEESGSPTPSCAPTADPGELDTLGEATALVETLLRDAVHGADGTITWVAPQLLGRSGRLQLGPLGPGLYDGAAGLAVFLAAHHRVTGDDRSAVAAAGCWATVREQLAHVPAGRRIEGLGAGLGDGVGSLLYAGVLVADLLGEDLPRRDAVALAGDLSEDELADLRAHDLLGGTAGLLTGLLVLHRRREDPHVRRLAEACGRRLLEERRAGAGTGWGWSAPDRRLLTGYSHGAAGVVHALARLHRLSGTEALAGALAEAVERGLAHERALFDPERANWPDLRDHGEEATAPRPFGVAWCHGAPGIGLGRLALLEIGGPGAADPALLAGEVDAALRTTRRRLSSEGHGAEVLLCCGTAGRAELLLEVGRHRGRADLVAEGRAAMAGAVARSRRHGHRFSRTLPPGSAIPGLFTGAAGFGYQLLRTARPDLVPRLLTFELP
ncbi:type 2 lanthipeptide synthetase LanM [Actinomycetospora cinnamomea]|uniref:Type 2 lantibiotic biosynthesis protein LanM n=1 Tax=Actinomycetospora cinnamomea TaxID=663609 RepID=A0A2U1FQZ6_9PSEU|nr:type 2 lanthipeptide synthetase LanM [Actinomycetospora cinnamomea]PVZ14564.1 type 2 lantibiotic biosynthesis protein LanM [Actinomycetospora cinnamomea]